VRQYGTLLQFTFVLSKFSSYLENTHTKEFGIFQKMKNDHRIEKERTAAFFKKQKQETVIQILHKDWIESIRSKRTYH
jgi:predicted nucleic acid-binding Zn ribbon protein